MPYNDPNFEITEGVMGIRRRRLMTFTLSIHTNGRFLVHDDRGGGKVVGSGFASADDAVAAYEDQDARRIGAYV